MIAYSMYTDMRAAPGLPPTPAHYDRVIGLVRLAERLGYRTVWATEQHVDDGYLPAPLIALSAFARETSTIRLGTGVHLLTLTDPRRVAEEAGVLDVLSNGRLTLGVGAGLNPHEFRIFHRRLEDRARSMEDGLSYLRRALSGEPSSEQYPISVGPVQRPVPLIVGGLAKPAVDRAARLADGHLSYSLVDAEVEVPQLWNERIAPAMERHGRTPGDFRLALSVTVWASDDWEREWREHVGAAFRYQQVMYAEWAGGGEEDLPAFLRQPSWDLDEVRRRVFAGRPDEVAERLSALREVFPFDEIVIWPALPGVPFELAEKCLRTFATQVAPAITG
ncbi:monooxygenase [Microtetraspora sp. NBRC 13810]|nr:monooxygenase [Microtetraspora sp. NBRC 13810]